MNRKQLFSLVIVGLIAGAVGFFVYNRGTSSWKTESAGESNKLFPELDVNAVAQMEIIDSSTNLTLLSTGGVWQVQQRYGYPADYAKIRKFLISAMEMKGVQSIPASQSSLYRFNLLSPIADTNSTNTGTLLVLKNDDSEELSSLLLGKEHMREASANQGAAGRQWPNGRYVLKTADGANANPVVWVINDPLSQIESSPADWLSKDFIELEKIASISITPTNAAEAWTLVRDSESDPWKLENSAEDEELDSNSTRRYGNLLSYSDFADVANPELNPEVTGLDEPVKAVISTFDGFTYTLNIGNKTNANRYVALEVDADIPESRTPGADETEEEKIKREKEFKEKVDNLKQKLANEEKCEDWVYLVSNYTLEPLLKARSELLKTKEEDAAEAAGTSQTNRTALDIPNAAE
ncbi:MAG: DUF4340 domain-containing protein [Verrucomicrobia bacterium]|nr:DUF4340 domain-containing protein [Verrucomicrobiota bacterium]